MTAMEDEQIRKVYLAMHERRDVCGSDLKEVDAAYVTFEDAMEHSSLGYVNAQADYMKCRNDFKYDDNGLTITDGCGCRERFYVEELELQYPRI